MRSYLFILTRQKLTIITTIVRIKINDNNNNNEAEMNAANDRLNK